VEIGNCRAEKGEGGRQKDHVRHDGFPLLEEPWTGADADRQSDGGERDGAGQQQREHGRASWLFCAEPIFAAHKDSM
jgi:hypothetical protein